MEEVIDVESSDEEPARRAPLARSALGASEELARRAPLFARRAHGTSDHSARRGPLVGRPAPDASEEPSPPLPPPEQSSGSAAPRPAAPETAEAGPAEADGRLRLAGPWSFLRAPSQKDIAPKRRRLAFDRPVPKLAALVVIDFEWTADKGRGMRPCAEIIQFPGVVVRFDGKYAPSTVLEDQTYDTFVKPRFNPTLTAFSKELCAITQEQVDAAPDLTEALRSFLAWLRGLGMVTADGEKHEPFGRWCFATWSDADIGGTLVAQLREYSLELPPCFSDWVDLKQLFQRHYKRGPQGGLRRCVEYLGLRFEGRAHNGLVDAVNTARIAAHMARDGFTFQRPTRAIDPRTGRMFGQKPRTPHGADVRPEAAS